MAEPKQKRGKSCQTYGTPRAFLNAVENRFGPFVFDLACTRENMKCPNGYAFPEVDALALPWASDLPEGNLWLNPPFGNITPWAAKCAEEGPRRAGAIFLLTPAAIGTEWFARYVHRKARVLGLSPRLQFEGMAPNPKTGKVDGFPKDLMLSIFGLGYDGFDVWRWDSES